MQQREIYILGTGIVTPHGEQQDALPDGASASQIVGSSPLTDTDGLTRFVPKRALRRIDHFSRLALYAAFLALEDAGLMENDLTETGISLASGFGAAQTTFNFLDSFLDDGDRLASPTHFSSGLHNAAAAYIAMQTKAQGPSVCTSNVGLGPAYALSTAVYWLQHGMADYVLVGGVDEHCQVLEHCVNHFQSSAEQACLLSDAVAGEGAAFMVLSTRAESVPICKLTDITMLPFAEQQIGSTAPLILSSLGSVEQHHLFAQYSDAANVTDVLPVLGIHPSALAFSTVQAARNIASNKYTRAQTLGADALQHSALITLER
ncbi:beta-ketoacyl synthase N-terminal-like domain-containing protein [Halodesulfovibrio spirochaetisodalis]|uniref:beta-ketoacyl synthase N-terminal-like domain-containing protein n=1 Tax=Halodesulfovibrio spirochaetisodalis TaxID=1560234 RepID=UPI0008323143|nr:beta-ketoacyl synthase N-terminal-like domain-containing protein [Halodesulfovibrio spirochaetisodalis]